MKIKYIVISILLFCCIIPKANALCSRSDILRAKSDAHNITIDIKRLKDENGKYTGKYNVVFQNFIKDFYMKEKNTDTIYTYNAEEKGVLIAGNIEGGNLEFDIYYPKCADEHMRKIKYTLPKYNYFSDSTLCEGISEEELEICGNWYQGELNEESFEEQIKQYKQELEKQNKVKNDKTILNQIKYYLIEYYVYIISGIISIVILISIIVFRKRKYSLD